MIFNGDILAGVEIDNLVPTHTSSGADATRFTAFATYWHGAVGLAGRRGAGQQHPFRQRLRIGEHA